MRQIPFFSVIIPTHNHAHFLPACLASVRNQTCDDYEIIVVNNGSTDNTEDVIKRLNGEKIRYHYQEDTGSVAGPRNTGIRLARGEYVAFLDSDDVWYPDKLRIIKEVLFRDPGIDIVSHDLYMVRPQKPKRRIPVGPLRDNMFESLLMKNCLLGSATVARREMMRAVNGFDGRKEFVHTEDYETWLRIAALQKKFYFVNKVLGEYRVHAANLSFDFVNALQHEKNVIDKHFPLLTSYSPLYRWLLYRKRVAIIYSKMSVQFMFRKQIGKGFLCLLRSFILDPVRTPSTVFRLATNKT